MDFRGQPPTARRPGGFHAERRRGLGGVILLALTVAVAAPTGLLAERSFPASARRRASSPSWRRGGDSNKTEDSEIANAATLTGRFGEEPPETPTVRRNQSCLLNAV